ncbi:hypothetical protein BHE74_00010113 [Ensete ventricosum]|nr:hypothetical protein BHE74_00010113 [Ensete ventricosum]RZR90182.1 hypothetical protein BHM03_00018033 [Ensete ventricosum]
MTEVNIASRSQSLFPDPNRSIDRVFFTAKTQGTQSKKAEEGDRQVRDERRSVWRDPIESPPKKPRSRSSKGHRASFVPVPALLPPYTTIGRNVRPECGAYCLTRRRVGEKKVRLVSPRTGG